MGRTGAGSWRVRVPQALGEGEPEAAPPVPAPRCQPSFEMSLTAPRSALVAIAA